MRIIDFINEDKKTWMKDGVEMCSKDCCGQPVTDCECGPDCPHCECYKLNEAAGVGKITKQNTTPDVKPGETERQAKKFFPMNKNGKPKPLGVPGATPNQAFNLGMTENISVTGTERGKQARKKKLRPGSEAWFKHWFSLPLMKRESFEQAKAELVEHINNVRRAKDTTTTVKEDFGSVPPLAELILMAVVAKTTVSGLIAAFKVAVKTGKGINKLRKLHNHIKDMGEDLADYAMPQREEFNNAPASERFMDAALQALHRLVTSKGKKQSIGGYAFDIARAFDSINARQLEDLYLEKYGVAEEVNEATISSQQMLTKLSKEMQGTHTGVMDINSDWSKFVLSHKGFTLKDIQVDQIPTAVKSDGMSQANIEKYKKADTSQFPPMVIGNDGYLLDGNHRLQAYKAQGIKTVKAYIGENETVNEATEMKISDLTISDAGMAIAQSAGGGSRTDAPLTVTKLPSGHVYLVNGYHRLIDAMKSGKDTVAVEYVPYEKVEILWKQEREQDIKYGKQFNVDENFADGKVKGKSRPGRVKRSGASCNGSVTELRAKAKKASGEKAKMYHWCANMKSGKKK